MKSLKLCETWELQGYIFLSSNQFLQIQW
jgi:hypothetical protein